METKAQNSGNNLNTTQSTSQGNSNVPTRRFFLKMPVRLAPWARKNGWHASPRSFSHRHKASESESKSEKAERERERDREEKKQRGKKTKRRERTPTCGKSPHSGHSKEITKTNFTQKYSQGVISQITKTNLTHKYSQGIIFKKLRIKNVILFQNYAK